jgi:RDD family
MVLKRILAFLLDLLLSTVVGFIFLFPLAEFLGKNLGQIFIYNESTRITDLGGAYLFLILVYVLVTLPFALMPFRFLFKGSSLGSSVASFHIENIKFKKHASWGRTVLRSPALLILGPTSFLHLVDYILIQELYPDGPYDLFLSIHFILLLVSLLSIVLLIMEWLWVLFSKDQRSFGEKWSSTQVKIEMK